MRGETTCPTCGGPADKQDVDTTPPGAKRGHFKTVYRTTADPERVARMEELLWEVLTGVDDDFDGFSYVRDDILRFFGRDPDTEPWPSVRGGTDGAE